MCTFLKLYLALLRNSADSIIIVLVDEYYVDNPVMDNGHVISANQSHPVTSAPRPQAHGYPRATTQQPAAQGGYYPGYQQQPQQPYHGYGAPQGPQYVAAPSAPPPEEPQAIHSGYGGMNPQPGPFYGEPPPPYSESELPPAKPPVKS